MNEENAEENRRETDSGDDSDDSDWNDGLTETEIRSVVHFLQQIANNEDYIEAESEDDTDEHSDASMTTVATNYISEEEDHPTDEEFDENEFHEWMGGNVVFYFPKQ